MGFFDTLKNGIFGGGKTGPIFYPNNSLIKDYGMNNAPVFAIDIAAYKAPEQTITKDGSNYAVKPQSNPTPLAEYNIIYSAENITINHSHQFGNNGFWGNLANKAVNEPIMGLGITGKDVINGVAAMNQLRGTGAAAFKTEWNTFGSLDISKSYTGSTPPSITLQFNLVTHKDPLLDVVLPATVLSYMTYPKAGTNKDVAEVIKSISAKGGLTDMATSYLSDLVGIGATAGGAGTKQAEEVKEKSKGVLDKVVEFGQNVYAGKWRYIVGDAPPVWTVLTSNNIFGLYNASVTNMSVTYNGPWLKSPSGAVGDIKNQIMGSTAGFNPSSVFPSASGGVSARDLFGFFKGKELGGYPSSASISMTFESNYSQFFGEELLSFLTNSSGIKGGIISSIASALK